MVGVGMKQPEDLCRESAPGAGLPGICGSIPRTATTIHGNFPERNLLRRKLEVDLEGLRQINGLGKLRSFLAAKSSVGTRKQEQHQEKVYDATPNPAHTPSKNKSRNQGA
jgi:hypothetical protein